MWGSFVIDFSQNTQRLHQVLFWKRLLLFVGNKVKGRIPKKRWLQKTKHANFPKSNILNDCNGTRTHNHLVCKRTPNHLAKLASRVPLILIT